MGSGVRKFLTPLPISYSPLPILFSAANLKHFDIASHVVALHTHLSVIAAEDSAPVVLFPVVATETASPAPLGVCVVLFDRRRRWRVLVVASLNRMAGSAVHELNMLDVRELGAVSAALELCGVWLRSSREHRLCVANHTIAFHFRFVIEAARRVAFVTFGVRTDGYGQSFLSRFMAVGAIHLFAVRQFVSDVQFVLFGVEERVEVVAQREIALRRARVQTLLRVMADDTGLLRF